MKRLVILHPHFTLPGGAGVFVLETAKRLAGRGWEIIIVCIRADRRITGTLPGEVRLVEIGGPLSSSLWFWLAFPVWYRRVLRVVERSAPDVIFPQVFPANWWGFLFKRRFPRVPMLWMCQEPSAFIHSDAWIKAVRPFWKRLLALILRPALKIIDTKLASRCDRVMVNSCFGGECARAVYGFSPKAVEVCHLGADQKKFGVNTGLHRGPRVITVGRLTRFKNVDIVLAAVALLLHQRKLEVRLSIVGRGEEEAALKRQASALGISEQVTFHGTVDDAALTRLLQESRAFVLASKGEPFGLVAVEAMACGTPAVVIRPGGPSETVIDGETGFCLNSLEVNLIAQKLEALLRDDDLFARLSAKAAEHAKSFNWDNVAARVDSVLMQLEGMRRAGPL